MAEFGLPDWRDRKVREWLLLLLRFAVTRESSDWSAVAAIADELDSLGCEWRPAAPSFFHRTSNDICEAILAVKDGHNNAVLRRHLGRIDDIRLRRAFQAAIGLHQPGEAPPQQDVKRKKWRRRSSLWVTLV
jgi:hypothetical protein